MPYQNKSTINKQDPMYEERVSLATRAFASGCIIFSSDTKEWYTPREFVESNEVLIKSTLALQDYSNMTLLFPKTVVGKELEILQKAQERYNKSMDRILTAFELKPIPKGKK